MFKSDSDIDYICDVIEGMESFLLGTEIKDAKYKGDLVMGVLYSNGVQIKEVAGTEGFIDSFKAMVEKVYTSIKNFFKSIWTSLFGEKNDSKEQEKKIHDIKSASSSPKVVEGLKGVHLLENKDKMKGIYEAYRNNMEDLSKSLKDKKVQMAVGEKTTQLVASVMKTTDTALAIVDKDWDSDPSITQWATDAIKHYKSIDAAIAAAEAEWKKANAMIDEIKKAISSVSADMTELERRDAISKLNETKNSFRLMGQVLSAVIRVLRKMKSMLDSNLALVHKKVFALEHK